MSALLVGTLVVAPTMVITGVASAQAADSNLIDIPLGAPTGLSETVAEEISAAAEPEPQSRAAAPDDAELVTVPDAALRNAIASSVGASPNALTKGDLRSLRSLTAKNAGITDLTGLEHASNLDLLYIDGNQISSLEPIRGLPEVRQITASRNPITEISALETLPKIDFLELNWTQIDTLEPLRGNTSLLWLQVAYTKITSLDALRDSVNLLDLNVQNTAVSDLSPLAGLSKLSSLAAPNAQISDLEPLRGMQRLRLLNVNNNHVTDISMLDTWPRISTVGFNAQTIDGGQALVPAGAESYRRSDVVSMFAMAFGLRQQVADLATPTADGEGAEWSGIAEDATELQVYLEQPVVPNGPEFSATVTYSVARAAFTNPEPGAGNLSSNYRFSFSTTDGFVDPAAAGSGYSLVIGEVPGLSFDANGVLQGVPSEKGSFTFTVRATDRHGNTMDHEYTINVAAKTVKPEPPVKPGPPTTGAVKPPLANTGAAAPWALAGVALLLSLVGAALTVRTTRRYAGR